MTDEEYIKLAINTAKKGSGKVSPNPMVGCVIVKNGKIIGKGYHKKYGEYHAEINAIKSALTSVKNSTVYVTLEPCSIYGNTPPCVERLIKEKVKRVVIGTKDINPLVNGRGIAKLKKAKIYVSLGVKENECKELNKFFNKYISEKIPYITLKAAVTLDGKIADERGNSKWISSIRSRKFVHKLRSEYDAVLIGYNTFKKDNPSLNIRFVKGRNPHKIILDSKLRINTSSNVFISKKEEKIIIITANENKNNLKKLNVLKNAGAEILFVKKNNDDLLNLKMVLIQLAKMKITSVIVEGGSKVFNSFIKQKLFDELMLFVSPKIMGRGLSWAGDFNLYNIKKILNLEIFEHKKIGNDILIKMKKRGK
ncbi:MAG: bifunctional diaminohydroxyphosphoribosylaminopyrimidine deaminase/5-amino-6-(5-phosphoribosylamino)uracil reductase RibD [Bacteroidetes bacterium]|nr:bifunctional diaminohydroxyphosphoribosylaminopyrimidine deaminase/5-amino-6-(5-phosphoribosylamino)uracil reductase RibD [Bacteroidota bacterium]